MAYPHAEGGQGQHKSTECLARGRDSYRRENGSWAERKGSKATRDQLQNFALASSCNLNWLFYEKEEHFNKPFFFPARRKESFGESQHGGCTDSKNHLAFYNSFDSSGRSRVNDLPIVTCLVKIFRNKLIAARSSDTQNSALLIIFPLV